MSSFLSATVAVAADPTRATATVAFSVHARAEPGVMPRVLELFAKRGLVPHEWHSRASGPALTIDVQVRDLERQTADYIARCMRQVAGVETVLTVENHAPG